MFAKAQVNGLLGDIHSVRDPVADFANSVAKESALALAGGPAIRGAAWGLRGLGRGASKLYQLSLATSRNRAITRLSLELVGQADTAMQLRYLEVLRLPPATPIVTIEHVVPAPNIAWVRYVE